MLKLTNLFFAWNIDDADSIQSVVSGALSVLALQQMFDQYERHQRIFLHSTIFTPNDARFRL